ncbi:MAG: hypothetical protein KDI90_11760 [Alphaproteobacteria bacterium]|nr:hypothetical protein [Alphaproteobacteria bacterium]MCB9975374.1 hypothetical protein [Rhodospirillales bacterium]
MSIPKRTAHYSVSLFISMLLTIALGVAVFADDDVMNYNESTLTGDWGGLRTQWHEAGYDFELNYTANVWRNFSGGVDEGNRVDDNLNLIMDVDAEKAFAVVADEVKKLATETGKKTEEIEGRIADIQNATQASVQAMQVIIKNVSDIDGLLGSAAGAVEEQNSTIAEITRNIAEVASAAREVSSVIGNVQQGASETGQSAEMLSGSADNIASLADNLDRAVSAFLGQIRNDNKEKPHKAAA